MGHILDVYKKECAVMKYITRGTCSREIEFEVDGNIIQSVKFVGGCAGNTAGVASLIQGMDIHEAISRIKGICRTYRRRKSGYSYGDGPA